MLDKILTHYERRDGLQPDLGEAIANKCLYFLRTGCGKSFEVTTEFRQKSRADLTERISSLFFAIISFPLIIIGSVAVQFSKTYGAIPLKKDDAVNNAANNSLSLPAPPPQDKKEPPLIETLEALKNYISISKEKTETLLLKYIDLSDQTLFEEIIAKTPHLVTLELTDCKLPSTLYSLRKLKQLKSLKISNCSLNILHVAHMITILNTLMSIDFSHNSVGDFVSEIIRGGKGHVNSLNLDSTDLSSAKAYELLDNSYNKRKIDHFSFRDNPVSIESILEANLGNFESIHFKNAHINEEMEKKFIRLKNRAQWDRENSPVQGVKTSASDISPIFKYSEAILNKNPFLSDSNSI
ncbi:MAG: hypothetical protein ACK4HV_03400 [Parachlamydiaceae bacterium]